LPESSNQSNKDRAAFLSRDAALLWLKYFYIYFWTGHKLKSKAFAQALLKIVSHLRHFGLVYRSSFSKSSKRLRLHYERECDKIKVQKRKEDTPPET
jgi:hypothetical protein